MALETMGDAIAVESKPLIQSDGNTIPLGPLTVLRAFCIHRLGNSGKVVLEHEAKNAEDGDPNRDEHVDDRFILDPA